MEAEYVGMSNPADEVEAECPCCGDLLDCEVFTDQFNDDICGDCLSENIALALLTGKYEVAYVGNGTFKVAKNEEA